MYTTPKNVNAMLESQILELVEDWDSRVVTNKANRLNIIKIVYSLLGYQLQPDVLLALLAEPTAELVLATAGGGKTTMSQVKAIIEKIVRRDEKGNPLAGNKMLCLVYNKQNVGQMQRKHAELVTKLYAKGLTGVKIDKTITCRTMHGFCDEWKNQYIAQLGLLGYTLLKDNAINRVFQSLTRVFAKKYEMKEEEFNIANLTQLYNLLHESLMPYDRMDEVSKFEDFKYDKSIVIEIFEAYDKMKTSKRVYDFTDMLIKVLELLKTNEKAREEMQMHYSYIIADEIQDFTPIMMEILRWIVGDKTPLLCIGDEDQCIYGFRGADIYNTLDFEAKFKGGKVYSLGANRRCGKEIFEAAKFVVGHNRLRFDKDMFSTKAGGNVEYRKYYSQVGQLINIVNELKDMPLKDLDDTIICYREKSSSLRLTSMLEEHGLPFYVISGFSPYSHELYKHLIGVLDLMSLARDREYLVNLYKITELSKAECQKVINYDAKNKKFRDENDYKHFIDRSYGEFGKRVGFLKAMNQIHILSQRIDTEPMKNYFEEVFEIFKKYFWNWKKKKNNNTDVDEYFEEQIKKIFMSDLVYDAFSKSHARKEEQFKSNQHTQSGIAVSTFHKLKGLEFKNVYMIDLADDIFPNYSRIDLQKYPEKVSEGLKESEVRLMFVAMTRAIDNLYMYYDGDNPSLYIQWLLDWEEAKKSNTTSKKELEDLAVFSLDHTIQHQQKVARSSTPIIAPTTDYKEEIEVELIIEDEYEAMPKEVKPITENKITSLENIEVEIIPTILEKDDSFANLKSTVVSEEVTSNITERPSNASEFMSGIGDADGDFGEGIEEEEDEIIDEEAEEIIKKTVPAENVKFESNNPFLANILGRL